MSFLGILLNLSFFLFGLYHRGTPLHCPRSWDQENRRRKKLLTKTAWYRPHNAVGFFPATPRRELATKIKEIVSEETARLGLNVKVVETGGVSLKNKLVKLDLTGCNFPGCLLCLSGEKGGSHTRRGPVYTGKCKICGEKGLTAEYHGESGFSAYNRFLSHEQSVNMENENNAFTKHLEMFHPERRRDMSVFKIKVVKTFTKCLDRQVLEGTLINNQPVNIWLNSKVEFHQSVVPRVVLKRDSGT